MFVFIWIIIACTIIGLFLWSMQDLTNQKKAWKAFAMRYGWTYQDMGLYKHPIMEGQFEKLPISMFSIEDPQNSGATRRFMTVLEINLPISFPGDIMIASPIFEPLVNEYGLQKRLRIDIPQWRKDTLLQVRDSDYALAFFTKKRTEALIKLFQIKDAQILLLCDTEEGVIRLQTHNQFHHPGDLNKTIKHLSLIAHALMTPIADKNNEKTYAEAID